MGVPDLLKGWGLLDYKTEKYVLTKNRRVGVLQRVLQLGLLGYVVGWSLLFRKGYQEKAFDPQVSIITKLKGVSVTQIEAPQNRLWDVADYVKPPQGENVFFLVTNFLATPEQVQGTCPEHPSVPLARCLSDDHCPADEVLIHSHGIKTGKCTEFNSTYQTCEIRGWCPVESSIIARKHLLPESENFTLFIKNSITFPEFNFFKTNTLETGDEAYFKGCRHDALSSPFCPIFRVRDMVEAAGGDFEELALLGGVVRVQISWDCDLDHPGAECQPGYSFQLQDKSYNFRTANHWWKAPGVEARSLLKLYGIRFDILVAGQAGKFSIISTGITLGTGLALLGLITFLCDLFLLYVDGGASFYRGKKYEEAKAPKTSGAHPLRESTLTRAPAPRNHEELGDSLSVPALEPDFTLGKEGLGTGAGRDD